VNAALKKVGAEHDISPGTIRSWRARHGRSQPVGDRNAAVAVAQAAIVSRVDGELVAHLDAAAATRAAAVALLDDQPSTAAKLLSAANGRGARCGTRR
jgi:transposase-like protein